MSVILSPKIYVGQYDLTGFANQGQPTSNTEKKDPTTFGDAATNGGCRRVEAGFETVALKAKIFWKANSVSPQSHDIALANWKVADTPVSWCPQTGAAGEYCQFFKAIEVGYSQSGKIGDYLMADLEASATGASPNIYGTIVDVGTKVAGANGASRQLGLIGATQKMYALVHIFALSGGTFTLKVQSDDNSGFTSPIDRITFAGATVPGWQWLELAGPIASDNYWRSSYTLTGGSVAFALHVGIL